MESTFSSFEFICLSVGGPLPGGPLYLGVMNVLIVRELNDRPKQSPYLGYTRSNFAFPSYRGGTQPWVALTTQSNSLALDVFSFSPCDPFYDRGRTIPLKCFLSENHGKANLVSKNAIFVYSGHGITHQEAIRTLLKSVFGWGMELLK